MFTQSTVISITGMKPSTLQNWMNRGVLSIPKSSPGREKARLYEAIDVLRIAFVCELTKFGIAPNQADSMFDQDNAELICDSILSDQDEYFKRPQHKTKTVYVFYHKPDKDGRVGQLAVSRPDIPYLIACECPRAFDLLSEITEDQYRAAQGLEPLQRPPAIPFNFLANDVQIVFCFDLFCERIALALAERFK
jgi:DNA-binding transcriptional MerR regulator